MQFMTDRDAYNPEDVKAILRVSIAANEEIFQKLEREGIMVGAFERVFHKELTAAKNDGITIGEERGITIGEKLGETRGIIKGKIEGFAGLIRDGILTLRDAASRANMTEDEFSAQMAALGY